MIKFEQPIDAQKKQQERPQQAVVRVDEYKEHEEQEVSTVNRKKRRELR